MLDDRSKDAQNPAAPMNGTRIAGPDVTIVLDGDGVIQDVAFSDALANEQVSLWLGRSWSETVAGATSERVRRIVEDATNVGVSAFRQVVQRFPSGRELPIEYTTISRGEGGGLIAVGKNLQAVSELQSRLIAAQQAMEQDYWKLREVETRYRLLFDASAEALLLLDVGDLKVLEPNPAAIRALGVSRGWEFMPEIAAADRESFRAMLLRARESGKAPGIVVHIGPEATPWLARASLMNAASGAVILLQLSAALTAPASRIAAEPIEFGALIDAMPDGFVVIDREGVVRVANRAFATLAQAAAPGAVIGKRLDQWLRRPGADLKIMLANIRKFGSVRLFSTAIQGELGSEIEVEVSASGDRDTDPAYIGLVVRDIGRRLKTIANSEAISGVFGAAVEPNGTTPLRELVQDAVGVIERHYLEAALRLMDGNRTAAAEMLGLSRQTLYLKLNRYGIDGGSATD